jgi:hypothetical protein
MLLYYQSSIQASTMPAPRLFINPVPASCSLLQWTNSSLCGSVTHQHPPWTEPIAALAALLNTSQQQSIWCSTVLYHIHVFQQVQCHLILVYEPRIGVKLTWEWSGWERFSGKGYRSRNVLIWTICETESMMASISYTMIVSMLCLLWVLWVDYPSPNLKGGQMLWGPSSY